MYSPVGIRFFYALCDIDGFKALKEHDVATIKKRKYEDSDIPNPPFNTNGWGDRWGDAIVRA